MSKPTADDVLDILRANHSTFNGSADELIDWVFKRVGVKRVVGPPPTNMTPAAFMESDEHGVPLVDELAHKPIHVSSGDKEWVIVSYYDAPDGHMCIDIEEIE